VTVEPEGASEPWNGQGIAGTLIKSDEERRYTLTVAYPANKPDRGVAKDGYRDFAGPGAIEDAAWGYLLKSPKVGLWHAEGTEGAGDVVESYIWRGPDWPVTAADGSTQVVKAGDWLVGIRWTQETWPLVKEGRIGGVSMQGTATRRTPSPQSLAELRS
jgi:hypothetical protein